MIRMAPTRAFVVVLDLLLFDGVFHQIWLEDYAIGIEPRKPQFVKQALWQQTA